MRGLIGAGILAGLCTAAGATGMDDVVLPVPRAFAGEPLNVAVSVGAIGRQRVEISTAQGQYLGAISLFGVPAGRAGGIYAIPIPAEAVHEGRLELRLTIVSGAGRRAPTADEVTGVRLVLPEG